MVATETQKILAGTKGHFIPQKDGSKNWNPYSQELNQDYEKFFTDLLLDQVTKAVGAEGWGIVLNQMTQNTAKPVFLCDIYTDNEFVFQTIVAIVNQRMIDVSVRHIRQKLFAEFEHVRG